MSELIESYVCWACVDKNSARPLPGVKQSAQRQFENLKNDGEISQDAELMLVKFATYKATEEDIQKRMLNEAQLEAAKKQNDAEG